MRSNDLSFAFTWVKDEELQKKGIDLKLYKGLEKLVLVDIKGISVAKNHHYMEDISIELVSDYEKFVRTKGKEGQSWLLKNDSKTDYLLYYWLDDCDNVKPTIFMIDFKGLKEWVRFYFNLYELYPFLKESDVQKAIATHELDNYKTAYLGKFKKFKIFSAKNVGYFTINFKIKLKRLNAIFKQFDLGSIIKITDRFDQDDKVLESELKMEDFL